MSSEAGPNAPTPAEVWSTGDYAGVCDRMIPALGARLVELAAVGEGEDVLDVAAGTGNAALPAAGRGAAVTALDITAALIEVGAARAAAASLDIDWVHGDAEAMPFGDARFDCVLSCVGVQFCADQAKAAAELRRVCRPGGRIVLISWTAEGMIGTVLAAVGRATGAAPTPGPLAWGSERRLEELFAIGAGPIATTRERIAMPARSPAAWVDFMANAYGPLLRARIGLQRSDSWEPLRQELIDLAAAHDAGVPGRFEGEAEYLAAVIEG